MSEAEGDVKTLQISVSIPNGEPLKLRIKKDTKFSKVFKAVADNMGVDVQTLSFVFDGARVNPDATPKMLEMEEDDQIDCMVQQVGGR